MAPPVLPPVVTVSPGALRGRAAGSVVALPTDAAHHLRTVLRARPGDPVEVVDGDGSRASARLGEQDELVLVAPSRVEPRPCPTIEVVQGLPRGRKLDEVVRALTELGVDRILPIHSARSPVQLRGAKAAKATARWRAVAKAAAEQSRRSWACMVDEPAGLAAVADLLSPTTGLLVAHLGAQRGLAPVASALLSQDIERCVVAIGPESGWSDQEVATMLEQGGQPVHLGSSVLRTEHAALVAAAVVAAAAGRMG